MKNKNGDEQRWIGNMGVYYADWWTGRTSFKRCTAKPLTMIECSESTKYKTAKYRNVKMKKNTKRTAKLVATTELLLCKYKIQNIDHSQQCTWNSGDPKCSFPAFYKRFDAPKRVAMLWKPERTKHLPMDVGLVSKNILYGIIFVLHILVHVGWREATHLQMSKWGEDWSPASLPNMSHLRPLHIDNHGGPCWCWEPGPWPDELPGQLHRHVKKN